MKYLGEDGKIFFVYCKEVKADYCEVRQPVVLSCNYHVN
jgi:hypothetical protein